MSESETDKKHENEDAKVSTEAEELEKSEQEIEAAFAKLQEELGALHDRYLRLGAEFENFKKRAERERLTAIKFANEALLVELLPVLDHLEHALVAAHTDAQTSNGQSAAQTLVKGVSMVLKQFEDVLSRHGIKGFSAKGQIFDPNLHEAIQEREDESEAPGTVLEEYQKGYSLNDRLVRPARVVVAKPKRDSGPT